MGCDNPSTLKQTSFKTSVQSIDFLIVQEYKHIEQPLCEFPGSFSTLDSVNTNGTPTSGFGIYFYNPMALTITDKLGFSEDITGNSGDFIYVTLLCNHTYVVSE